jgi:hypothetical protein
MPSKCDRVLPGVHPEIRDNLAPVWAQCTPDFFLTAIEFVPAIYPDGTSLLCRFDYTEPSSMRNGMRRSRFPVAAKMAFAMAGPVSHTAASPSPCGSAWLSMK